MAVYSLEDFKRKLSDKIVDNDDLVIELLEDLDDSFTPKENTELEEMKKLMIEKDAEIEKAKADLLDLKARYKERFLSPASDSDVVEIDEKVPEEVEEKEIIDIKEI
jgi:Zn-dependent oligopeptidase